ncbi:energy-coupling factor ABC transporter ATP-binding protein [Desulfopila inferna]|uniref:energy-coupling factor ABC transporter ATP-binding protein n=1 Tax=Desulfopila inferna TaxID=468528 RepID=UPI001963FEE8|nr:ATP-binding cassette domain-containing protein [Desulfopila inferna]MBM9604898.1 ATP-binding cassette domain-containing protein [Desulfopila inferna]
MLYKIRSLRKIHGNSIILDIDALDIAAGKVYTLIGPNGAGKTTLLNILAFLENPTEGKITFRDAAVQFNERKLHQLRQKVSLMDQYPILFTGTVRNNIEFGLKIRKIPAKKRAVMVKEVLEMVGMSAFIDADAHKLSGGETKRVALARALAIEPEVMLCDEPTANVDSENQEIILSILERCNREKKVSLIFATHYLSQAGRLADHTIILQNGRLSAMNRENVFRAEFVERSGKVRRYLIGGANKLYADGAVGFPEKSCMVNIDPRKISLLTDNHDLDLANIWQGRVTKSARVNNDIMITVDCGVSLEVLQSLDEYLQCPVHVDQMVGLKIPVEPLMFHE